MRRVNDQVVLIIYGLALACTIKIDASLVIALLLATSYSAFMTLTESNQLWRLLCFTGLFFAFSVFYPLCLLFSPLVVYHMISRQNKLVLGVSLVLVLALAYHSEVIPLFPIGTFLVIGLIFAAYADNKTQQINTLATSLQKTRDDSTELTLLLQEKNRSLRDKQDYEIYAATLKERNRIAREIHDNVGHLLSRAILITGAMKMTTQNSSLREPFENLDTSLGEAMDSIRKSVHDLHDDAVDLKKALEELVADFSFCPIDFSYHLSHTMPREVKYNVIAIVKEALNNVIKHSNATLVRLTISESQALYQLIIEDNGTTITPDTPTRSLNIETRGIGLINMTERVKKLHGTITFYSQNGFIIYIKIPKQ
ncbi:sensor histidine kinase [Pseudolactococcus reticulitermitis]|uniref:histidine kinase n=1 Tax=Pseudolactococcus reticulitermitis TaxID=2025039 RepID=A0A224X9D6_9LACT|nr:histidine kinase [Lactococcus reticulitermitis]GAX46592.1 sensor histidine kinase [Lactococcus reticulitermitis]